MRWFRRKTEDEMDEGAPRRRETTAVTPTPIPPPRSAPRSGGADGGGAGSGAQAETPATPPSTPPPTQAADAGASAPVDDLNSMADMARVPSHARDSEDMDPQRRAIVDTLRSIYDPEIPVNIYDIGLIYDIDISADSDVDIRMTLTSPMCPVAETLPPEVETKVAAVDGIRNVTINLVWEPSWSPVMMSDDARLLLNMM